MARHAVTAGEFRAYLCQERIEWRTYARSEGKRVEYSNDGLFRVYAGKERAYWDMDLDEAVAAYNALP
jgi:hypothetical protein